MTPVRRPLFLAGLICLLAAPTLAVDDDFAKLDALLKGAPAEVVALVGRELECHHWGGEEPYDAQRRAEILRAVTRLKCDTLAAEEAALRHRHAQSPPALRALDAARDITR